MLANELHRRLGVAFSEPVLTFGCNGFNDVVVLDERQRRVLAGVGFGAFVPAAMSLK